jgi:ABC-2 type transport system ATP-binding protein
MVFLLTRTAYAYTDKHPSVQTEAPMTTHPAIAVKNLHKVYRAQGKKGAPKIALDDMTLTVPQGTMMALLGPNGAGKSTLINILAGLVDKSGGQASIWGLDIDQHRTASKFKIGIVPQELNIDPFFTPREALELQAGLYGVPPRARRTMEILEVLGLADKADAYARTLSGGMRRRMMVAKAMVHNPPILVLDEPTAGVDIQLRQQLWDYVVDLNRKGTTILLTTHYLEEAEKLCDRIAVIHKGKLVADAPKEILMQRVDSKALSLRLTTAVGEIPAQLRPYEPTQPAPDRLLMTYQPSIIPIGQILADVAAAGLTIADLSTKEADLEDVFLQLTQ